jgi:drug/metabolite transporter (DMT)-like permease
MRDWALGRACASEREGGEKMSALALGLVVIAAAMHAGWNLLAKRSTDRLTFMWLFTVAALLLYAPVFAIEIVRHPTVRPGLIFVLGSTIAHIGYYSLLSLAYERSDLSLAYPVARGFGVLLTTLLAAMIFGDRPTLVAWIGIAAIVGGIIWLHAPAISFAAKSGGWRALFAGPALLTGITISAYSLIDTGGVRRINQLVYLYMLFALIAISFAPYILRTRRTAIGPTLMNPVPLVLAGLGSFGTYLIVLSALRIAPVAYVVPVREISIVFAALLGAFVLKETFGRSRYAACIMVAAGVILIGVGG